MHRILGTPVYFPSTKSCKTSYVAHDGLLPQHDKLLGVDVDPGGKSVHLGCERASPRVYNSSMGTRYPCDNITNLKTCPFGQSHHTATEQRVEYLTMLHNCQPQTVKRATRSIFSVV